MDKIDDGLWRKAMGGFLSGITIVTTHHEDGAPAGTAVNAFCAVSMDPPLLLVCLDRKSRTLKTLRAAGSFCVNILSDRHEDIVSPFAAKHEADRFAGVAHCLTAAGDPVLDDAAAWFDCVVHAVHDGGDHDIVVGRVTQLDVDAKAAPLAYHHGRVWPLSRDLVTDGAA